MKQMALGALALLTLAAPAAAKDLRGDLMANEKLFWDAWGKRDPAPFRKSLTVDAAQIVAGAAPLAGREAIAKSIAGHSCQIRGFSFSDSSVRMLSSTVALLNYSATQDATCEGTTLPPKLRVTSIWVRQGKMWRNANYQETPVK